MTQSILIGERSFDIGPLTLGTVRRVPEAFQMASTVKSGAMPTAEQFDAMVAFLYDGINAPQLNADPPQSPVISLAAFNTLVNVLGFVEGVKQLSTGMGAMLIRNGKAMTLDEIGAVGNSVGSESVTSPVSSD